MLTLEEDIVGITRILIIGEQLHHKEPNHGSHYQKEEELVDEEDIFRAVEEVQAPGEVAQAQIMWGVRSQLQK